MDTFVVKKRKHAGVVEGDTDDITQVAETAGDEVDTDTKLAILASLLPEYDQTILLDALIESEGSVEDAVTSLRGSEAHDQVQAQAGPKKIKTIGYQSSLAKYNLSISGEGNNAAAKLTKRGQTLHLYSPEDVAAHTPCSIIHNFLPAAEADALLNELLTEAKSFGRQTFRIFDNVVQSPHSACFYVGSTEERERQQTEYLYNGGFLEDIRQLTPQLRAVAPRVRKAVNEEIAKRIKTHYPEQKKLKHQYPGEWLPNAAFVNCYAGGAESVGYHSDQLTYLGPRAVIGSISLGVARQFRVRKIVPKDDGDDALIKDKRTQADEQGQIAIHLPHNSLLVMHAEMQEEWKHSISPAQSIDPHPIAGNRRINITYRHYREEFHPKHTPRCRCNIATVLKCVQRQKETRGRYMWMCHAGNSPDKDKGCGFFQWAEFDDDGHPPWYHPEEHDQKEPQELLKRPASIPPEAHAAAD